MVKVTLTATAALLALTAPHAKATTVYDSRTEFLSAVTPTGGENFDDIAKGSSFEGQELDVGFMTFSGGLWDEVPGFGLANIIAPTGGCNADYGVDATNFACVYVSSASQVRIDMDAPVTAWGSDIADIGDEGRMTGLNFYDSDDTLLLSYLFAGHENGDQLFFGVDFGDVSASYLTFYRSDDSPIFGDAFGLDYVVYETAGGGDRPSPVPLPATSVMLLSAFMGIGGVRAARALRTA